jgi:hypothetical protein
MRPGRSTARRSAWRRRSWWSWQLTADVSTQRALRAWAGRGLAAVLGAQILANLLAGYLRGGRVLLEHLGGPGDWPPLLLAGTAWLVANALIPGLVFILAKIEAHLLRLLFAPADKARPGALTRRAPTLTVSVGAQAVAVAPTDMVTVPALPAESVADTPALTDDSKRQRVAALAAERRVSERTIWRQIKAGKIVLE